MSLQQVLRILSARRRAIFRSVALVFLLVLIVSLLLPKKYRAQATVVVSSTSADPVLLTQNGAIGSSYLSTQIEIINSPRVAAKAVILLGLDREPGAWRAPSERVESHDEVVSAIAESVSAALDVKPASGNVIAINYTSADDRFAAEAANAFAQAYLETAIELRIAPARQNADFFDSRAAELRTQLQGAQSRLSEYQKKNGIIRTGIDNRLDIENAKLADLSTQLTLAQTQRFETQSRQIHAQGDMSSSPDVLQSPVVQQLRSQLAGDEAKLKQLSMQLGPNHPQYVRAAAELAALNAKLRSEMSQVASSILTADRVSAQKVAELRDAVEIQRQKILALSSQNDDLAMLQREVSNAQAPYDLVVQRYSQTNLQSQSQQADVALLTSATVPSRPYSPKIGFNLILAVVLGLTLGLASALVMELTRPLIRSADDLLDTLGLPVLATLPSATRRRSRFDAWIPAKRLRAAIAST